MRGTSTVHGSGSLSRLAADGGHGRRSCLLERLLEPQREQLRLVVRRRRQLWQRIVGHWIVERWIVGRWIVGQQVEQRLRDTGGQP
jgi:hypothetical protein